MALSYGVNLTHWISQTLAALLLGVKNLVSQLLLNVFLATLQFRLLGVFLFLFYDHNCYHHNILM